MKNVYDNNRNIKKNEITLITNYAERIEQNMMYPLTHASIQDGKNTVIMCTKTTCSR